MDLVPVLAVKTPVGQQVILRTAHQLGMPRFEGVDQLGPVLFQSCKRVLVEGRPERRSDDGLVLLDDAGMCVAPKVDAAALYGRIEHLCCSGFQSLVVVGDD